jgi:tetratricopeptide (TPR) repeat protein
MLQAPTPAQSEQMHSDLERMNTMLAVPVLRQGTKEQIQAEINRLSSALDSIGLVRTPILGPRYASELDYILGLLDDASAALERDDNSAALNFYKKARSRTSRLTTVFRVETAIIEGGVPEALPGRITLNGILDAVEATLSDRGPLRERAKIILAAATLYAKNADLYNSDNPVVRQERNALFDFIMEVGAASRTGASYTNPQENLRILASFRANARRISDAARETELAMVTDWRGEISRQLPLVQSASISSMLRSFDQELEHAAASLESGKLIHGAEFAQLEQRFYSLTGTVTPITHSRRVVAIYERANELASGRGRNQDRTPAWYGAKALEALDEGNSRMASLAVSMGMLERAAGGRDGGMRYLPAALYNEMHDTLSDKRAITAPKLNHYLSQLRFATLHAECDRMENEAPLAGTPGRREMANLIHSAVAEIRRRASVGDMTAAQRLFEMTDGYERLIKANGWNQWPGSSEIQSALHAELDGTDGTAQFERGLSFQSFSGEIREFRSTLARWGDGLSHQREALDEALTRVRELAHDGRFAEARRLLTFSVMYADGVVRLSVRTQGRPTAIDPHVAPATLGRMESALSSLVSGNETVDDTNAEELFMNGYSECMQTSITLQASSLASLARSRPVGQEIITDALDEARARGNAGDFRGAITLLAYIEDFYGAATAKKVAGWRYAQFDASYLRNADGISRGRDGMLVAIERERRAASLRDHASAERLFSTSVALVTTTTNLVYQAAMIRRRYLGESPTIPGDESTKGIVSLSARNPDGSYQHSLPLEAVRGYESAHSNDPALGQGPTLEHLLRNCRSAARSGDVDAYNSAVRSFNMRFELVVGRAANDKTYAEAIEQLDQVSAGIMQMAAVSGMGPARLRALGELSRRTSELREALATARASHEQFPSTEYLALLADVASERRLAMGISTLSQQITLGDEYLKAVRGERGDIRDRTVEHIDASREHLVRARAHLLSGNREEAAREYTQAIARRTDALVAYRADNAVGFIDVATAHRSRPGNRPDMRFFPSMRTRRQYDDFEQYMNTHNSMFSAMLSGNAPENIESAGRGTILIESSIFGVPADAPSQFFDSFVREQSEVRELVAQGDLEGA